eukprot:GDKK01049430.1.p1 GENE.GDKK01049430.1~~GDKK01049430.1.p1  ORF type:complete len:518 (-),score=135.82 GDKK01049430.1:75-1421(-)
MDARPNFARAEPQTSIYSINGLHQEQRFGDVILSEYNSRNYDRDGSAFFDPNNNFNGSNPYRAQCFPNVANNNNNNSLLSYPLSPSNQQRKPQQYLDLQVLYDTNILMPPSYVGLPPFESARLEALETARRGSSGLLDSLKQWWDEGREDEENSTRKNMAARAKMPQRILPRILGFDRDDEVEMSKELRREIEQSLLISKLTERLWILDQSLTASRIFLKIKIPGIDVCFSNSNSSSSSVIGNGQLAVPFQTSISPVHISVQSENGPLFDIVHSELCSQMTERSSYEAVVKGLKKSRIIGELERNMVGATNRDHLYGYIVRMLIPEWSKLKAKSANREDGKNQNDFENEIYANRLKLKQQGIAGFDEGSESGNLLGDSTVSPLMNKMMKNGADGFLKMFAEEIKLKIVIAGTEMTIKQDVASLFIVWCLLRNQLDKCSESLQRSFLNM